jgi:ubiquinone/menaquinone biosynthesis C-methylase UbiE
MKRRRADEGGATLFLKGLIAAIAVFIIFQIVIRIYFKICRSAAPAWIGPMLDSRWRRRVQPPARLIERSGVRSGMAVLEIGCGSGAFTPSLARAVGGVGHVCAFDLQGAMLERLKRKLERAENGDISNVMPICGDAIALPFADNAFDLVIFVTVLQEIPDREAALGEVRRVLGDGGICSVSELLPDPDYPLKRTTVRSLERAGFDIEAVSGGIFSYTVRAVKSI